jgi:NAD+ kinase
MTRHRKAKVSSMKSVLIFTKKKQAAAIEAGQRLKTWLQKNGYKALDVTERKGKIPASVTKNVVLGVVIGGDGTFLTLVRRLEAKSAFPLLGVNLGSLGFITEFDREDLISIVEEVLKGKHTEVERPLLRVELLRGGKKKADGIVFNDAVLAKDPKTTMIKFDVSVQGEFLSFVRADGYIVSTATGSTAYALSVGGPLIHPDLDAIVLVPICAHALSARPVVVPGKMGVEIAIKDLKGGAYLVYDGQINFEIQEGDRIRINADKNSLRLVKAVRQKWPEALRTKLNMG